MRSAPPLDQVAPAAPETHATHAAHAAPEPGADSSPPTDGARPGPDEQRMVAAQAKSWRATYANAMAIPFWGIHVGAAVGVIWLGWSWQGLALALASYLPRMFFVTAAYHRYFSHRAFKTSRGVQLALALGAMATTQKGVLWWAAHHRTHHKLSDQPGDLHSVRQSGFWWAHMGWILCRELEDTDLRRVRDLARFPELRWLDRYWFTVPVAVAVATFAAGGWFALVWAFAVTQVLTWHGTFTINSLSHLFGSRRYPTSDDSRNNLGLALLTLGEGWHNNHHHYQVAARQGFRWWEVDLTYYVLRALAMVGLIWDLHGVPPHIRDGVAASPPDRLPGVDQLGAMRPGP
ncbi:MAG TPA: acyl-CoA desaturase [Kofleriaceae bacterium]|nr:acyl-CoA desaturase [Kofleriaceae bacterium]